MIDQEKITSCINDMIRDGHIMESGDFVHPDGIYGYKFKKLKKRNKHS